MRRESNRSGLRQRLRRYDRGHGSLASTAKAIHALSGAPAAGLTVTGSGTSLSATTNAAGYFQIATSGA